MIADGEIGHTLAERRDHARRLVSKRHRHGARPRAVDHRQVGMAQARGRDLHQNLPAAGGRELQLHHVERLRLGVGRRQADCPEDGGSDAQGGSSQELFDGCCKRMLATLERPRHRRGGRAPAPLRVAAPRAT